MPPHCAVSIIIPAYNEADRIGDTVAAVLRFAGVREVVVVDDGSPDGTAQVATDAGASSVLVNEKNLGKGRSLMRGVEASSGGVLLFLDADLGFMHWPTFNVADISIAAGVIALLLNITFDKNSPLVSQKDKDKRAERQAKKASALALAPTT